jgi:aspartate/methionine/tyrosine aminotransferase
VDSITLCRRLVDEVGVLLVPGTVFGKEFKGYVRVGFVSETAVLKDALEKLRLWMRKEFDDVSLAE